MRSGDDVTRVVTLQTGRKMESGAAEFRGREFFTTASADGAKPKKKKSGTFGAMGS